MIQKDWDAMREAYEWIDSLLMDEKVNKADEVYITNVIFNEPATIVFWNDGVKTVVKAQGGEPFDAEKGLAMAIVKRAFGNSGNYNDVFRTWIQED